jgi:anti-sigma B factor antagonist
MKIEITEHLNYSVVLLSGEVDLSNSSVIRKALKGELNKNKSIIVDFTNLKYIDSSGMATLVEGLNQANAKKLKFYIAAANGAPLQVLELTRLNRVFTLVKAVSDVKE